MQSYCADLHIHSVLSPCGDLDMSPAQIIDEAVLKGLDIIAVTDHNHTGNCKVTRALGAEKEVWVVYGAEITSREDVHCLAFFDTDEQLEIFQIYIDKMKVSIGNDISLFGDQLVVDSSGNIKEEIEYSLYPGLISGIRELSEKVSEMGGYFVPAHVDRYMNGMYSQLGLFPEDLKVDAIEIYRSTQRPAILQNKTELSSFQLLKSSDAHFLEDIGRCSSELIMKEKNFKELGMAFRGEEGRMIRFT